MSNQAYYTEKNAQFQNHRVKMNAHLAIHNCQSHDPN